MAMDSSLFEELGLSMNEAKIYSSLLTYGGSGVSTISLRAKIHRSNAYDSLKRLIEKGLVYEVLAQKESIYEAVDPNKLRELLDEKMQKLDTALPAILKTFNQNLTAERAYIFKGIEGVKNYMRLALKEGKDIHTIGANGGWLDPRLASASLSFIREAHRKNMKLHIVYNEDVAQKLPDAISKISTRYKLMPKKYQTSTSIDIFGDHVVTFADTQVGKISDDATIFVLVSKPLAESYRTWWQFVWDMLPEPKKRKR